MKTVKISMDLYLQLVKDRLDIAQERWGNDASKSLMPQFLELVEAMEGEFENNDPDYVVDNFVINGEFVDRKEFEAGNYYSEKYDTWSDLCDNAVAYNDNYACINF